MSSTLKKMYLEYFQKCEKLEKGKFIALERRILIFNVDPVNVRTPSVIL